MKIKGIAHRGDNVNFPENTISAFQAAVNQNYTHLELDVHLSKEGIPVVIHDRTLDRMTNGKGFVKDYTLSELKKLKVKDTETIPTLEEVLEQFKGKISILIELKQEGNFYPNLEGKVVEVIERTATLNQVRIISFDHFSIQKVRGLHSSVKLGLCTSGSIPCIFSFMKEINCDYLGLNFRFMTPLYGRMMEENNVIVNLWMIDKIEDMNMVTEQYPTAIITTNQLGKWSNFYLNHQEMQHI
nr:glycerophosphodiester phosphodiesterase family protein [Fredinandcohnia onubensis]